MRDEIADLDEAIKRLQGRRERLWRAKIVTLGELLDLSDSLGEESNECHWHVGWRLERILRKL